MTGKIRLTLIVRRGLKMDDDGAISGCKAVRDQLAECLGYPSDAPKWMNWGPVIYDCGHPWKGSRAHMEIWVDPVTELNDDVLRVSRAHREGQLLAIMNRLLSACDWLLALEGCDLPAAFRQRVVETHGEVARFVGASP